MTKRTNTQMSNNIRTRKGHILSGIINTMETVSVVSRLIGNIGFVE